MNARQLMVKPVIVAREDATVEELARLMLSHEIGCLPIVTPRGALRGIVTASDFVPRKYRNSFLMDGWAGLFGRALLNDKVERIYQEVRSLPAREVMSLPVITAKESDDVDAVVNKMLAYQVHHIPVVRDGVPVGIIARRDLLLLVV